MGVDVAAEVLGGGGGVATEVLRGVDVATEVLGGGG